VALAGRIDSRRREWRLLVLPMIPMAPVTMLMLVAAGTSDAPLGYLAMAACLVILGLLNGPMDIGLFTMRQRRTDPALLGRAFAVSMAFNFLGYPVGAAIAGALAADSLEGAVWLGVVACALASLFAATMVPRQAEPDGAG
jgi:MFS family permease